MNTDKSIPSPSEDNVLSSSKRNWLDRPLLDAATLNWEKTLYGLFIALAVLSRLWNLGLRAISHDETIHAQWSWYLYQGRGYDHHPLSHGPFLFHATALSYYLFGDSEFTARLTAAVMGVVLVALPYALRRWLGRSGALVTSFLFLISPSLLYYSRYARHDVPVVVWSLFAILATFCYLEPTNQPTRPEGEPTGARPHWLIILAASLSLMFATKEVSFFYIAILGLFLVILFFVRLGVPRRRTWAGERWGKMLLTVLGLIAVVLLATSLLLFSFYLVELFPVRYRDCGQAPVPGAAPGEMSCTESGCELIQGRCQRPLPVVASDSAPEFDETGTRFAIRLTRLEMLVTVVLMGVITTMTGLGVYGVLDRLMPFRSGERPALDLILFIGSFSLPFLAAIAISGLSRVVSQLLFGIDVAFYPLDYSEAGLLRSLGFVLILLATSVTVGLWWDRRRWLPAAGVFYVIFVVLFTTVFTNGNGLASGMVGSLGYWLEQQAVERGGQPLYYYSLMVSLYEYLPLLGFAAAIFYVALRGLKPKSETMEHVFVPFLFFWTGLSWLAYSLAGEKMPWMTVHIAVPMILASGWVVGKLIEGTDGRAILRRGGWAVILVTPLALAALVQTISPWLTAPGALRPFSGHGLGQLNATMQFCAAFLVLAILVGVLYRIWQRVGGDTFRRALAVLALGLLAIFTVRTAWALSFINADYASEFLVFAHATPDVREVMAQIEDISQRTSGERTLDVAYTADGSYPFMWYLRNYRNASQLPNPPSRPALDKSVVIAGDKEWSGVEPYLGEKYVCNHYNFMWWPMQDYFGLTWDRIRHALTNPQMREAVWDIFLRRDYDRYEQVTGKTVRLSEWPLRAGFRFCVRRDVQARMWGESAGPVEFVPGFGESDAVPPDYAALEQLAVADLEIKSLGAFGGLNSPHGMALDKDGFLYVADTDNHRIVKLSLGGEIIDTWDSTWWRGRQSWQPNGCLDQANRPLALGEGEFCEPWGVAVGPDGQVYVSDTWNHRVQVFSPDGQFLNQVGTFGQSGGDVREPQSNDVRAAPGQFYGPRDVAVDREGRVYVSDTGNKRVQVFDADLRYLFSFGGPGVVAGRMDEPVGLAIVPEGLLYVADTWNQRVQAFTQQGDFVRGWPIAGWQGQSPFNKPYLAADSAGRVYASDPEGLHVIVFDDAGTPLVALDLKGADGSVVQLPVGVALDAQNRLWVSDAANHRLLRFPALDSARLD